jgi:hypothetical protein
VDDATKAASAELQSWYEDGLRPRLARAARLGIADPKRLAALDRELRELIGAESDAAAPEPEHAKAA